MVVWEDLRGDLVTSHIYGARVYRPAAVMDRGGIPISPSTSAQSMPAVSYDGNKMLVIWRDNTSRIVLGTR